ncbi:hypothetical protein Tco_1448755, partial [Tanacetum coccineum]
PQDFLSTFDRRLIKLENQVQCLMEAHISPMQPTQVNKITSSCEMCSGPHDTQYCMEVLEQAFVEYASSRTNKVGGLVSNFMASQDAKLSKFEADFKQQQSEMTNKIDTVLKAITDRMARALPSDTVKNPKLNVNSTSLVLSAHSYPTEDPQCSTRIHEPSRNDEEREIEWLDVEEPLDLVDIGDLDNSTSNVLIPLDSWTSGLLVYKLPLSVRMIEVIKREFEKIKDVKVKDVPLIYDASLEVFNDEVSRLSKIDDDLFTYEVKIDNIPCDSKIDNDSEQEADGDIGYDPSDIAFIE